MAGAIKDTLKAGLSHDPFNIVNLIEEAFP